MRCPKVVGRDGELEVLLHSFDDARGGSGSWANISGEAGIGKSRLVEQLAAECEKRGGVAAVGRTSRVDRATPYRPLAQALLSSARGRPRPLDPDVAPYAAVVAPFVPHWQTGEPRSAPEVPTVMGESFLQVLVRLAAGSPMLLILEDLHWADGPTAAACAHIADRLAPLPALVVATFRAEEIDTDLRSELVRHRTVELRELAPDAVEEMAVCCLGGPPSAEERERLRASGGLPLLVEDLLETRHTDSTRFADIVRARVAALSPAAREAVVAAALVGEQVERAVVEAALPAAADGLAGALSNGLLVDAGGGLLRFRHALTHELVLGLAAGERARIAARVAETLEVTGELPLLQRAAELWAEAGHPGRGAGLLRRLAADAHQAGLPAAALTALGRAAVMEPDVSKRLDLDVERLAMLADRGRVGEAEPLGADLLDRTAHDPALCGRVHLALARCALAAGQVGRAVPHLERASVAPDLPAALVLHARAAMGSGGADRRTVAEHLAHQATAVAIDAKEIAVACEALEVVALCARSRSLEEATSHLERGLALADAHDLDTWRLRLLNELGTVDMLARADGARLQRARAASLSAGALDIAVGAQVNIAALHAMRGELEETRETAGEARVTAMRLGLLPLAAAAVVMEALSHGFAGRREQMESSLRVVRELAPDDEDLDAFAWGAGRGLCALLREDRVAAAEAFRRATREDAPIGSLDTARAPLLLLGAVAGTATEGDRRQRALQPPPVQVGRISGSAMRKPRFKARPAMQAVRPASRRPRSQGVVTRCSGR